MIGLEAATTKLHAGAKFNSKLSGCYSKTGGLHGVGLSVVNALSEVFIVEVHVVCISQTIWNDRLYSITCNRGIISSPIKVDNSGSLILIELSY